MSLPDGRTADTPGPAEQRPRLGVVFTVIAAGVAMANLDVFIVNVALPDIGHQFSGTSLASLSWVLNAYAVVFAALLVPAGNFADRVNPRIAYLSGIALFTFSSVLCALAPGIWLLVGARVLQAVGAAMLIPSSLGLLLATAPPEKRLASVRGWTAISGVASALGPVLGGLLTDLSWHWVFLVNVPIGVAALLGGLRVLPRVPSRDLPRADVLGAAVLTASIALIALGLVRGDDWGWASEKFLGALVLGVLGLVWFTVRSARHASPVLPLPLFRFRGFSPSAFSNVLFAVAFAAMLLSTVLWCQDVWHWSAVRTGLAIFPGTLLPPALAMSIGPVIHRFGSSMVAFTGCVVFGAGIAWWLVLLGPDAGYAGGMLPGMLLTGIGVGLTLPTLISAGVSGLPPQSFSTGSGVITMARQAGTVLGISLLVATMGSGAAHQVDSFDRGWEMTLAATAAAAIACFFVGSVGKTPRTTQPAQTAEAAGAAGAGSAGQASEGAGGA
ncbi:MFS transporter [Streptomyces sp. SID6139]|nr:MFS transporter [Streptomyces sp. SID6139]